MMNLTLINHLINDIITNCIKIMLFRVFWYMLLKKLHLKRWQKLESHILVTLLSCVIESSYSIIDVTILTTQNLKQLRSLSTVTLGKMSKCELIYLIFLNISLNNFGWECYCIHNIALMSTLRFPLVSVSSKFSGIY